MTAKTLAAEEYLCQLELEILQLREVVSGLYQAGADRQSAVFYRYETLLSKKCDTYQNLRQAMEKSAGR